MISFEVPGDPIAWKAAFVFRNKHTGKSHAVKNDKLAMYQSRVAEEARKIMNGGPLTGPVMLEASFYFTMPKNRQRKQRPTPQCPKTTRPDLSNLVKCIEDALSSVVYVDDSQVVQVSAFKYFAAQGEPAKVKVTVMEVSD